ncbi:hypothetical protein [Rhizobium mesoamericanum]|uniref:Uncharacterized protein n=1 Tax=Rhizobium mesoamericanum STM3625 TaxID=1211777 RepID=K0PSW3_9HYPH|nr:hypothetical protein [Rhizobium mesoamericanum]CCM79831.1 hypothetical protein BN77_p60007 [Rhizobium mesoamericanum STM3625]
MLALENYAENKAAFINSLEKWAGDNADGARTNANVAASQTLKATSDAAYEFVRNLRSPVLDRAIETFYTSAAERALAARDLGKYLADAGLKSSEGVTWELHDNNWCLGAQTSITYVDNSGDPHTITVSGHYDSKTGWGTGVC